MGAPRSRRRRRVLLVLLVSIVVVVVGSGGCMFWMPGRSHEGPLPRLTEAQRALQRELEDDLRELAVRIGERNVWTAKDGTLERTEYHIVLRMRLAGLHVERLPYEVDGQQVANLVVEIPGGAARDEIVVVGAHFDTVPGCPGANDNGTGVVATLALARAFAGTAPRRTLRFAFFVNEEPPFFQTEDMGSLVYAKACKERGDDVVAMLSLETIGCYSDEEGSQRYPFPIGLLYPSRGNFVAFVGNVASRRLVRDAIRSFRANAAFPSEGGAVPSLVPGIGWSDHWAFWQAGYPAIMVTDTAPYRYAHYHAASDTFEHVDVASLARVVDGLRFVVADLAGVDRTAAGEVR